MAYASAGSGLPPCTLNGIVVTSGPLLAPGRSPSHPELHLFPRQPQVQTALRGGPIPTGPLACPGLSQAHPGVVDRVGPSYGEAQG